jgi:multiple sugar transport system substrate-binding protein
MLRTQRHRRTSFGIVALSLALVAASCGGDDDAADADEPSTEQSDSASDGDSTDEPTGEPTEESTAESTAGEPAEPADEPSGDRTTVTWFVGLGTGSQEAQIPPAQALVDEFNESQDEIKLEVQFVDNNTAKEALATSIAGGNPPDLIGPVGRDGAQAFSGQYLDLNPLIESSGIDLSLYEAEQIEARKNADGEIDSLPFASFPAALFYNTDLFEEAGLPEPPHAYGEPYGVGTEWEGEWNVEKMEEIALILTVDGNGNDATSPDFDRDDVVQWGFVHQWTEDPNAQGTMFGAGSMIADDGSASMPQTWVDEWKWYHKMIWEHGASPSIEELDGDVLGGNAFNSGKVAMAHTHLWYTCCLSTDDGFNTFWDVAALPSYNGVATAKLHADTFRIHKDSADPEAAFKVLRWIQEDAALDFLTIYGAMPARMDLRDAYFEQQEANFTQGVDWQVFLDGLVHTDIPSHEQDVPGYVESLDRVKELDDLINGDPDLDVDAAVAELEADLDAIWANAG